MVAAILDFATKKRLVKMITHWGNLLRSPILSLIARSIDQLKNRSANTTSVLWP